MRKRRYRKTKIITRSVGSIIRQVIFALVLAFVVVAFCFQIAVVHGHDMKPTWQEGDMVFIDKIGYIINNPQKFDVALLQVESGGNKRSIVRRIVGTPGDTVQIHDGKLYVNEKEMSFTSSVSIKTPGIAQEPVELKQGEYFVLCDNYNRGEDSRMATIGIIKKEQIIGRVVDIKMVVDNILRKYKLI